MKAFCRACLLLCCVSLSVPVLAQAEREPLRGEGSERHERREALREDLRRQQAELTRRNERRGEDAPGLRRLDAAEREHLRRQMREAARDGEHGGERGRHR